MRETEKTAIAAHLYVSMRRVANRVIDIEWLGRNAEYAQAILQLAREQGVEELARYADRYEALMTGKAVTPPAQARQEAPVRAPESAGPAPAQEGEGEPAHDIAPDRYIGSLR